jgi:carbon-monoxide dehydrogenase medium subunit
MGTVGGNICAAAPAGDVAAALLALDAQVKLASDGDERVMPLEEFYTGSGTTARLLGELLAEIYVPVPQGQTVYIKYGRKAATTPAVVTVAAQLVMSGDVVQEARLALNGAGPQPIRAIKAEMTLIDSPLNAETIEMAAAVAAEECAPPTDAIASEWYRRKMVRVYVKRALAQIAGLEA